MTNDTPLLTSLSDKNRVVKNTYLKNQIIYKENQLATGLYFLQAGIVGLYKKTESGKEHLIRVYGDGDYFGYRSLFSEEPYHLTTRALTRSLVLNVNVVGVRDLYNESPALLVKLMTSVCRELGEAEVRLSNVSGFATKVRILDSIVELFSRFKDYPWTAREVAEYSGTETQTVIRFCTHLKSLGLLNPNLRRISPVNLSELSQLRNRLAEK